MSIRLTGLAISVLGASCGGGMMGGAGSVSPDTIAAYAQLTVRVRSAAADHGTSMTSVASVGACQSLEDGYEGQVRPWVSQLMGMSGAMDGFMDMHGGQAAADLTCVSATMMSELDRHRSAACASPDLAVDREEARRHVDLMTGYAGHLSDRCGEMNRALDGTSSEWGTMMAGCQAGPDGMHGGGMMSGGGAMP